MLYYIVQSCYTPADFSTVNPKIAPDSHKISIRGGLGEHHRVQVDVDLMTREIEKAAEGEAQAKSALEEMKRDLDTNTVIMMSLQEQLKERDAQVRRTTLSRRCTLKDRTKAKILPVQLSIQRCK